MAVVCISVVCIAPVVTVSGSLMGMGGSAGVAMPGLAGSMAWLVLAAFVAAAASRYVAAMRSYTNPD